MIHESSIYMSVKDMQDGVDGVGVVQMAGNPDTYSQ
jgi:hypothetical protein